MLRVVSASFEADGSGVVYGFDGCVGVLIEGLVWYHGAINMLLINYQPFTECMLSRR